MTFLVIHPISIADLAKAVMDEHCAGFLGNSKGQMGWMFSYSIFALESKPNYPKIKKLLLQMVIKIDET